jgi:hypothetical protein
VVGHLPRLLAGLHDLVLGRGQETDVVEPRGPAAGDLSGVVVVLGVVDPAVTAGNLLGSVEVLKVTVAELVGADWTVSMWFPRTLLCVWSCMRGIATTSCFAEQWEKGRCPGQAHNAVE